MPAQTASGITYPIASDQVTPLADHFKTLATTAETALAGKAAATHTHSTGQVTGLDTALAGKAATTHTHTAADVSGTEATLTLPTGWANYGSDGGGTYLPARAQRLNASTAVIHGMIKCAGGMATGASAEVANSLPAWAYPRENALAFFGNSSGTITRVGVYATGKLAIYAPAALAANGYLSFSLTYPLA